MWYTEGLKFECQKCGDCCRGEEGYVWLRPKDIVAIAGFMDRSTDTLKHGFVRRVGTRYSLKELKNGDCVFWNNGCEIYPARPPQCRSFPFWKYNLKSRRAWEDAEGECPGINKGKTHCVTRMGTSDAFNELEKLYSRLQGEIEKLGLSCEICGECCYFEKAGHELFATYLEILYLVENTGLPEKKIEDGVCPYLEGKKCSVHEFRTLGCRAFFCKGEGREKVSRLHEKYRKEIDRLTNAYILVPHYAKMNDTLKELKQ